MCDKDRKDDSDRFFQSSSSRSLDPLGGSPSNSLEPTPGTSQVSLAAPTTAIWHVSDDDDSTSVLLNEEDPPLTEEAPQNSLELPICTSTDEKWLSEVLKEQLVQGLCDNSATIPFEDLTSNLTSSLQLLSIEEGNKKTSEDNMKLKVLSRDTTVFDGNGYEPVPSTSTAIVSSGGFMFTSESNQVDNINFEVPTHEIKSERLEDEGQQIYSEVSMPSIEALDSAKDPEYIPPTKVETETKTRFGVQKDDSSCGWDEGYVEPKRHPRPSTSRGRSGPKEGKKKRGRRPNAETANMDIEERKRLQNVKAAQRYREKLRRERQRQQEEYDVQAVIRDQLRTRESGIRSEQRVYVQEFLASRGMFYRIEDITDELIDNILQALHRAAEDSEYQRQEK